MIDILSLVKSGGQVKLEVTADDLQHFGEMLIKQARKEWEEERALAREEEPEEKFLSTDEVCKIFNVTKATLWTWHRRGYLCHIKFGIKNMYALSDVNAIRSKRAKDVTVAAYCKNSKNIEQSASHTLINKKGEKKVC